MAALRLSIKDLVRQASDTRAATGGAFVLIDRDLRWTVTEVRAFGPDTPWPLPLHDAAAAAALAGALAPADCRP